MIGSRIREERERLALNQESFAELAGAKRRTLVDWEKGVSSPTAIQLNALSQAGVDIQYVVIGVRSAQALPAKEMFLLELFMKASEELRNAALNVLLGGAKEKSDFHNVFKGGVGQVIERIESGSTQHFEFTTGKKK